MTSPANAEGAMIAVAARKYLGEKLWTAGQSASGSSLVGWLEITHN